MGEDTVRRKYAILVERVSGIVVDKERTTRFQQQRNEDDGFEVEEVEPAMMYEEREGKW